MPQVTIFVKPSDAKEEQPILVEFQGSFEGLDLSDMPGCLKALSELCHVGLDLQARTFTMNGTMRLQGRLVPLKKPILAIERSLHTGDLQQSYWMVRGIIREKLLFDQRPVLISFYDASPSGINMDADGKENAQKTDEKKQVALLAPAKRPTPVSQSFFAPRKRIN